MDASGDENAAAAAAAAEEEEQETTAPARELKRKRKHKHYPHVRKVFTMTNERDPAVRNRFRQQIYEDHGILLLFLEEALAGAAVLELFLDSDSSDSSNSRSETPGENTNTRRERTRTPTWTWTSNQRRKRRKEASASTRAGMERGESRPEPFSQPRIDVEKVENWEDSTPLSLAAIRDAQARFLDRPNHALDEAEREKAEAAACEGHEPTTENGKTQETNMTLDKSKSNSKSRSNAPPPQKRGFGLFNLFVEMSVACWADEFVGYGDGQHQDKSMVSLLVGEFRTQRCGTNAPQWLFEKNNFRVYQKYFL